ncbi:MAG: adenylosuccinate synthase [Planctomycetota bacterium]|jgi:adenylosuccinate synthase
MNTCVVGLQWGDEGKGKIVDILAENHDIVTRYSGGANAGHTVIVGESRFALHLLPSGSVRPENFCVIGNGVVLDPECLIQEIETLKEKDISLTDRLFISENAHVVLDYHKQEDKLREQSLGKNKIGTTSRGIGPCYADKVGRSNAIRMSDFRDLKTLGEKLVRIIDYKNKLFSALYGVEPINSEDIIEKCSLFSRELLPFITDTTEYLHKASSEGKSILFEGAQGSLLDLDHGTFPFVTSSNSSALGLPAGCGIPAKKVDKFIGVSKAYNTRVGSGPFPTELDNEIGQYIRDKGGEYGTTTGRPRRCGWFDSVATSYSINIGGIDSIALVHLDTLAGLKEINVCIAYEINGQQTTFFPADASKLSRAKCVYKTLPGWDEDITSVTNFDQLPKNAQEYVMFLEKLLDTPVSMIGVGPKRTQTIIR